MVLKRSSRSVFGRVIVWTLFGSAGIIIVFNMVFVLQTATELAILKNAGPDKTTFPSLFKEKRAQYEPTSEETKFLELEVYSSKENVTLTINGKRRWDTSEMLIRGLNVVVLNEVTGAVMSSRWYDTYESAADSGLLVKYLKGLRQGRIVCFAVKDDAAARLSEEAVSYLSSYGSSFVKQLQFRSTWAFIVSGTRNNQRIVHAESFQNPATHGKWANPVTIRTLIKLLPENVVECSWEDTIANRRRREFCDKYEGYGDVCRCEDPVSIELNPPPFLDGSRFQLPIAVMASNRPSYLLRMLLGLQKVEGLDPSMITVFIDGFWPEPASVTRLLGVKLEQHAGVSRLNARIGQHYKKSIIDSFDQHPDANFLLLLEEDLDVSVDILSYFKQLLPVYENDESVYCISAWNDQGYDHVCSDPAMMYRVDTMPGLGWVLSRKLFKNELEAKWPKPDEFIDWDIWMRASFNRKGRECIIPDISRTYHFGGKGLNVGGAMQALYFEKHTLNTEPHVKLDVEKMYKDNYEKEIEHLLSKATILDVSQISCLKIKDLIPDTQDGLFVFYIRMDAIADFITWKHLATCLRMWDLDARGFHNGMWRFWLKKNHVIVVGCPASKYCTHKPENLQPLYIPETVKRPMDDE